MILIGFLIALAIAVVSAYLLIMVPLPDFFRDTSTLSEQKLHPQKFHEDPDIPRIGGFAILLGMGTAIYTIMPAYLTINIHLLLAVIFLAFLSGLTEDIVKNIPPFYRLSFSFLAALCTCLLFDSGFYYSGLSWIDLNILASTWIAYPIAIFMIGGVMHSINIIDGYNGLALGISAMALICLSLIAMKVEYYDLVFLNIYLLGAILGVMLFNYPWGKLFMGDGGAYMIGFIIAINSLLLVNNNMQVSPWFPLMVVAYPVWETIFSIFRKKFIMKTSPTKPDGYHLHMLIYKGIIKRLMPKQETWLQNSAVAPVLWCFSLVSMIPAMLLWNNTLLLFISGFIFIGFYCLVYWWIYRYYTK